MSKAEKLVSYENYVSGIEASYQLGVMDGQAETQPAELRDLRRQLANMLISNKELLRLLQRQDIFITIKSAEQAITALRQTGNWHYAYKIEREYKNITGQNYLKKNTTPAHTLAVKPPDATSNGQTPAVPGTPYGEPSPSTHQQHPAKKQNGK